jgi:hypothetical protein
MAGNDNRPASSQAGDRAAVAMALTQLRRLEAPADKIKFEVAKQRWNWAAPLISEVYENASSRSQVIAAGQVAAGWQRYWWKYLPRKAGSRTYWLDLWLRTDERVERLIAMEAQ